MATIQGVYVALFGRPADPTGLDFFNKATNNGADLTKIADLSQTAEYKTRFEGKSTPDIVISIYQSLFNRNPEQAGLSFFVEALAKGTFNINNVAIAILDSAQGADKTTITNKIAAADAFTKAIDTPNEIAAYRGDSAAAAARTFLTPITSNTATIPTQAQTDAALKTIVDGSTGGGNGSPGTTLTLTNIVGGDIFTPTSATNKTTGGDDTINGLVAAHFSVDDIIDGGAGTDTLNAKVAGNLVPNLVSVEKINLTSSAASVIDLSNTAGAAQVTNAASTADLTYSNIAKGVAAGLSGTIGGASTFTYVDAAASSGSDTVNLSVAGANATTQNTSITTAAGVIENLAIAVNGNSNAGILTVNASAAGNAATTTVTGSGNLVLEGASLAVTNKFDASGLTGGVTWTAGVGVNFTGGKGADALTLTAAGNADVIVYNTSNVSVKANQDLVNTFTDVTGGVAEDKIDVKAFAFASAVQKTYVYTGLVNDQAMVNNVGEKVAVGLYFDGTNTSVFFDTNNDGKYNEATDLVVKLALDHTGTFSVNNVIWA